jgi:hypothetical protein
MQDTPSNPQEGTGNLSQNDAVNLLLDTNSPSEEVSEVQPTTEVEAEDVEAVEEQPTEAEAEETEAEEVTEEEVEETEPEETLYRVKVDGEEYDVNIEELKKNYQLEKSAQKRLQEAAEQRKELSGKEASLEQERQKYEQVLQVYEQQLSQPQQAMSQEQLAQLKAEDPIAYNTYLVEEQQRQSKLQAVQQEQQVLKSQQLAKQADLLLDLIPSWRDQGVAAKEKGELVGYLRNQGFSTDDINNATDARIVNMARKAQLYDNLQNKATVVKKKVVTAPKMVKAGQPKPRTNVSDKARKDAWAKLKKTNSRDAAVEYLLTK